MAVLVVDAGSTHSHNAGQFLSLMHTVDIKVLETPFSATTQEISAADMQSVITLSEKPTRTTTPETANVPPGL